MEKPLLFIVAGPELSSRWADALRSCGGDDVAVGFAESVVDVPPHPALVLLETLGPGVGLMPESVHFDPATVVATGVLPGFSPDFFTPDGLKCAPGMACSAVALWHSTWFMRLRRLLASGAIGAVGRVRVSCPVVAGLDLNDPDSPALAALLIPAGLAPGHGIDWQRASLDGDGGLTASGTIGGIGAPFTIEPCDGADMGVTLECADGVAILGLSGPNARLLVRRGGADSVVFDGHCDMIADTARHLVASAVAGRPRMMPITAGAAVRRSLEGLTATIAGGNESAGRPSRFEANRFRPGRDPADSLEMKVFVESRCNMVCPFCFTPGPPVGAPPDGWESLFAELRADGVDAVVLSGGEPTLNPALDSIVGMAAKVGFNNIFLETNGTVVDDALATRLARAGLNRAMVSLHSINHEVAAAVTGVPGTVPRTVRGISALIAAGIRVDVNFVITSLNVCDLPDTAAFIAGMVPRPEMMVISSMAGAGEAQKHPDLFARVSVAATMIRRAVENLAAVGMKVQIPAQCGLPPCVLPDRPDLFTILGVADSDPDWVACDIEGRFFADSCSGCSARRACFGIWKAYAQLHGTDEFVPLK